MVNPRATPFERDMQRMIDALTIETPRVAAADEALVRRIVRPDTATSERVNVHTSSISDPTEREAERRLAGQEQRDLYRDSMQVIWQAIKAHRANTDRVLHAEAVVPIKGVVCATKICTNYASRHTRPDTGDELNDLCDDCWLQLCTRCYVRPMAEYRPTCFTCYQRELRAERKEVA